MTDETSGFVEDLALWFENLGMARMQGRLLGWLLVCDPPHQSAEQLAEALQASRGSISTASRFLVSTEMVERVTFPGDRRIYYRACPDWSALFHVQLKKAASLRSVLERGLSVLEDQPQRQDRLRGLHAFSAFWERELTDVIARHRAGEQEQE